MPTLADMAKALNRPTIWLHGIQTRFELPSFAAAGYPDAYLTFLRTIAFLRALNLPEETLRDLWKLEKKLMQLLHADSAGSKTWFLDACGQTDHLDRRLLLSNYDLGVPLPSHAVQLRLDFSVVLPELFAGKEMGEDELRVLSKYLELDARIRSEVRAELPFLRAAGRWASRLK